MSDVTMTHTLSFSLAGKRALITGGGSGIGLSIAEAMVGAGAEAVLVGRREAVLQDAVQRLGEGANYCVGDISELETLPALVSTVQTRFGPVDTLVNNAGIHMKKPMIEVSDAEFQSIIATNLNAQFSLTREVVKGMSGAGSIINISSMSAIFGLPNVVGYSSSKTALLGMTRALAAELGPLRVRVNAIAPGFIDTEMMRKAISGDPDRRNRILSRTPLGEFGTGADIGAAAVYLASDAARFVTGVTLPVDGGNSIGF